MALRPDLIILDLGLPDMDGIDVLRRLREWTQIPVIILSVRDREDEKVAALDSGADDYVTKPFGIGELLARMRVALRKSLRSSPEPVYRVEDLEVDLEHRRVTVQGKEVQLTPTEYDLLRLLVTHAGKVLTHNQILRQLWGTVYVGQPHLLQVNVSNLRHKIEPEPARPRYILTELGVGYRLRMNP
jgi:two-component system KDP operon response regulator KdpE